MGETLAAEKIRQSGNTLPTAANHAVKVGAETQSGIFDRLGQSVSLDVIDGDSFDLVVIGEKASVEEAMAFGREAGYRLVRYLSCLTVMRQNLWLLTGALCHLVVAQHFRRYRFSQA